MDTITLNMKEAWSCNPAYLDEGTESLPTLTGFVASTEVDLEAYRDDPTSLTSQFVKDTNLGSEKNPYTMFGAFVADLHCHLASTVSAEELTTENEAEDDEDEPVEDYEPVRVSGEFYVEDVVEDDEDELAVDCEPSRWHWTYDPEGHVLRWQFWLKEKFLPKFADGGNSTAGRIAALPYAGEIKGIPFEEDYAVSPVSGDVGTSKA